MRINAFRRPLRAVLTAVFGWVGAICCLHAQIISVDFAADQSSTLSPSDIAGMPASAAANWNVFPGEDFTGPTALNDSSGSATSVTLDSFVSNAATESTLPGSPTSDQLLFGGYIESFFDGGVSFTVSNIPYASYDLIVYLQSNSAGRNGFVSTSEAGSSDFYFQTAGGNGQPGNPAVYTQVTSTTDGVYTVGNYAVFSGLTATSQTVGLFDQNNWSGITGFQIVAVPEPTATCLLLASGLVLLGRRRTY